MTEATTEKPTAKHRVRMTSAQYAAAIEQRMDGGEHVDGLKWDGHDLLVDDPAAVSATLTGMANSEDGQAEDSDGDTRKHARGASTALSNLALKVARLASDPEPDPEPEEPTEPEFKDAGWVIPHSRKEEARRSLGDILGSVKKNGLTRDDLADLEGEDPGEATKALTRGAISAGRLRNLKALGMTAGAAFLTQHIIRGIDPRAKGWYAADAGARLMYFAAVDTITDLLANCREVEDVIGVLDELNDAALGVRGAGNKSVLHKIVAEDVERLSWKFRLGEDITAENLLVAANKALYQRPTPDMLQAIADVARAKNRERFYRPLGSRLFNEFSLGYGGVRDGFGANRKVVARANALEATDDWSWAKRTNKDAEGGAWRRRVPAMPERVGPDEAPILDAEGLRTAFGIRGVQYGNYMDGDAAQVHTQAAGTALHDLAAALGIEPEHVSLNGRLSLAFGARGRGGKAAAHYERDTTAINLTKHAGSGTLAHEWGHFLDNILGRFRTGNDPARGAAFLTSLVHSNSRTADDQTLSPNVIAAFKDVQKAIMHFTEQVPVGGEPYTVQPTDPRAKGRRPSKYTSQFHWFLKHRSSDPQRAWEAAQEYFRNGGENISQDGFKRVAQDAANMIGAELVADPQRHIAVENPMLVTAKAMGAYWARPEEMFARSFEAFVTDKLAAMDRKNTYLVAGASEDAATEYGAWAMKKYEPLRKRTRGAPKGVTFSPYPAGPQRSAITVAFARLFIALREEGVFAKAIALMDARDRIL